MPDLLNIGVRFGAEGVPSITKSIAELTAQMKRFQAGLNVSTGVDSIARLNKAIAETQVRIKNIQGFGGLPKTINDTTQSMKPLTAGSNSAAFALQNVGRVAQDVPFGFIGIQNNLNPLLESFQRLKAETGSSGAAFKALGASLMGPAGIGIAISVISSAILLLTNGMQGFGRKTRETAKKAKEDFDAFGSSVKEVAEDLGRDVSRVSTLFNALTSGNLNLDQRKKALEELKGINQQFFGSLKEEKGIIEGLSVAYKGYLSNILQIGRAKAIETQITKLFGKKLELEISIDPNINAILDPITLRRIGELRRELETLGGAPKTDELKFFDATNEKLNKRINLQGEILKLQKANVFILDAPKVVRQIDAINKQIEGLLEQQRLVGNFSVTGAKAGAGKEDEQLKKLKDALQGYKDQLEVVNKLREKGVLPLFREDDALALQLKIFEALNQIDAKEVELKLKPKLEIDPQLNALELQESIDTAIERMGSRLTIKIAKIETPKLDIAAGVGIGDAIDLKKFNEELERTVELLRAAGIAKIEFDKEMSKADALKKFEAEMQEILIHGLLDAFSAAASGIGETLAGAFSGEGIGKGLVNTATNILKIIGGVMQQLGTKIVLASKLFVGLRETLGRIGLGTGSLIAGLGLIAAGALLKSIKFPAFAQGGIAEGPQSGYLALLHGREMVTPLNSARNTLGIEGPQVIMIESRLRGEDLELAVAKVIKRKNRTG